uniref:Uncharacterized protein n=1 Tax=Steinernema glaseri TaxID=37863 RepID=A0A1I8AAZ6_9BILA
MEINKQNRYDGRLSPAPAPTPQQYNRAADSALFEKGLFWLRGATNNGRPNNTRSINGAEVTSKLRQLPTLWDDPTKKNRTSGRLLSGLLIDNPGHRGLWRWKKKKKVDR